MAKETEEQVPEFSFDDAFETETEEATPNAEVPEDEGSETAPTTETPAEAATKETAPPQDEEDDEGSDVEGVIEQDGKKLVPLSVLIAERKKLQAKAQPQREEPSTTQQPQQSPANEQREEAVAPEFDIPDPAEDPQGYAVAMANVSQTQILNDRLNNSERFARHAQGDEVVDAAFEWWSNAGKHDKSIISRALSSGDPYGEMLKMHKDAKSAAFGDVDPKLVEQFQKWHAAQSKGATPTGNKQPAQKTERAEGNKPSRPAAPSSIADETSDKGSDPAEQALGAGSAFSSTFTT